MTLGNLEPYVKRWQRRLAPLGVGHWTIKRVDIVDSDDFHAEARCSTVYDYVFFRFSRDWLETAEIDEIQVTIIHEWLHVAWRDYEAVELDLRKQLGPVAEDLVKSRFDHEREGLIQRIAETIFVVHSSANV